MEALAKLRVLLGSPPRPGLVPQSGDPEHPVRWVRPIQDGPPMDVLQPAFRDRLDSAFLLIDQASLDLEPVSETALFGDSENVARYQRNTAKITAAKDELRNALGVHALLSPDMRKVVSASKGGWINGAFSSQGKYFGAAAALVFEGSLDRFFATIEKVNTGGGVLGSGGNPATAHKITITNINERRVKQLAIELKEHMAKEHAFLRQRLGSDTIKLYRGISPRGLTEKPPLGSVRVNDFPATAWTTDPVQAINFGDVVLERDVPIEHIVGSEFSTVWDSTSPESMGEFVVYTPPEGADARVIANDRLKELFGKARLVFDLYSHVDWLAGTRVKVEALVQLRELLKAGPPRQGLVPQSGDPEHPVRWIRPREEKPKVIPATTVNIEAVNGFVESWKEMVKGQWAKNIDKLPQDNPVGWQKWADIIGTYIRIADPRVRVQERELDGVLQLLEDNWSVLEEWTFSFWKRGEEKERLERDLKKLRGQIKGAKFGDRLNKVQAIDAFIGTAHGREPAILPALAGIRPPQRAYVALANLTKYIFDRLAGEGPVMDKTLRLVRMSRKLRELTKAGPPRPGLVPQSGDPEHPVRWIRPKTQESSQDRALKDYAAGRGSVNALVYSGVDVQSSEVQEKIQAIKQKRYNEWEHAEGDIDYEAVLKERLPERFFSEFKGVEHSADKFSSLMLEGAAAVYENGKVYVNPDVLPIMLSPEEYIPGRSPVSVAFHEFGHHVDQEILSREQRVKWDDLHTKYWRESKGRELWAGLYSGVPTYYALASRGEYFSDVFMLMLLDKGNKFFKDYPEVEGLLREQGLWNL